MYKRLTLVSVVNPMLRSWLGYHKDRHDGGHGWFRVGSADNEVRVERILICPPFEQNDPAAIKRVGAEGVLEATRLGSRNAHHLGATRQEQIALVWIELECSSDDDHGASDVRCPECRPGPAAMVGRAGASYPEKMALKGEYEPSPAQWVRDQVELYEGSGGAQGNTLRETGIPIIVVTTLGVKSGKIRKIPLMRVEHDGEYALVASKGGAPAHPVWYYNLKDNAGPIEIQDGPAPREFDVRELSGDERATWWERAVAAFPPYAEYQAKTDRQIPVFVASPRH